MDAQTENIVMEQLVSLILVTEFRVNHAKHACGESVSRFAQLVKSALMTNALPFAMDVQTVLMEVVNPDVKLKKNV